MCWTLMVLSDSNILLKSSPHIPPFAPLSMRDMDVGRCSDLDTRQMMPSSLERSKEKARRYARRLRLFCIKPELRIIIISLRSPVQLSARCRMSDGGLRASMMPSASKVTITILYVDCQHIVLCFGNNIGCHLTQMLSLHLTTCNNTITNVFSQFILNLE